MEKKIILIFPPNWSACVSGPHLALPLLAGSIHELDWDCNIWDLSDDFYGNHSCIPQKSDIFNTIASNDFQSLDKIYFNWEDQFRGSSEVSGYETQFGLLSGYSFSKYNSLSLDQTITHLKNGSIYTHYFIDIVIPKLIKCNPTVLGMTIASQNQIIPTVELLQLIRKFLPQTYIILGGNVVTRLRNTSALNVLKKLVDHIVLFQGDIVFPNILKMIEKYGVVKAKRKIHKIDQTENLHFSSWPVPLFNGINFNNIVGTVSLPYVSTRGCYWGKCTFCAIPAGWSKTGYAGSAPANYIVKQINDIINNTGIPRIQFVDETFSPCKVFPLNKFINDFDLHVEWEAYARLEKAWENIDLLEAAHRCGLRKLYFGLEQVDGKNRALLNKNDNADISNILKACYQVGVKVHLFGMIGFPGTSRNDAEATTNFLLENEHLIDTADLVRFRLERGTQISGIKPKVNIISDWILSLPYVPVEDNVLSEEEVIDLESTLQEKLWESVPRYLHPLYRVMGNWDIIYTNIKNNKYAHPNNYKFDYSL